MYFSLSPAANGDQRAAGTVSGPADPYRAAARLP